METCLQLFSKLPMDIIINHILPYTYQMQPIKLLQDIKSYIKDLNIIKNYYLCYDYNRNINVNCIIHYRLQKGIIYTEKEIIKTRSMLNLIHLPFKVFNLKKICLYNGINQNITNYENKIIKMIKNMKYNAENIQDFIEIIRIVHLSIGLLNPYERTRFINEYIIDENEN